MKKIVIFGAGNIGRSLIGNIFSRSGYEVVFIDIDDEIVDALNKKKRYRIEVKDVYPETIWVENVRAVHGRDAEKVSHEISTADIIATAVGVSNLQNIYRNIAEGLLKRFEIGNGPIDIIICENIRNASRIFREGLSRYLPEGYPLGSMVGLVETSIGKMVPSMTKKERMEEPLLVYAEAYNKIIVDKKGFKNEVPKIEWLEPKENIAAYVDLKLFVHNMGHAITAYLGFITDPDMKYIWEAISNRHIRAAVENAMWESGRALMLEYPDEFNEGYIREYISNLLQRFNNKALGDTIYRVGRDLPRKLSRNDRLIGSLLLDKKHSVPAPFTTLGAAASIFFRAKDDDGNLYPRDKFFVEEVYPHGIDYVLTEICGLNPREEKDIIDEIKERYKLLARGPKDLFSIINKDAPIEYLLNT